MCELHVMQRVGLAAQARTGALSPSLPLRNNVPMLHSHTQARMYLKKDHKLKLAHCPFLPTPLHHRLDDDELMYPDSAQVYVRVRPFRHYIHNHFHLKAKLIIKLFPIEGWTFYWLTVALFASTYSVDASVR